MLKKIQENQKKKNMIITWMLMWLNQSVATINAILQLLDKYRFGNLIDSQTS